MGYIVEETELEVDAEIEDDSEISSVECESMEKVKCDASMKEAEVLIQFNLGELGDDAIEKLFQIQRLFGELGIYFDTGAGFGCRDWEWDWSLDGPVKVYFKQFVEDNKHNRYNKEE